jgi:predicted nuclease of predicted toxin-antitoxin system
VRFLVDAQLPLARALADLGHDSAHVQDVGLDRESDQQVWTFAAVRGMTVLTKDQDFAVRASIDPEGPPIVWLRVGNTTRRRVLSVVLPLLAEIEAAVGRGERVIEIRG